MVRRVFVPSVMVRVPVSPIEIVGEVSAKARSVSQPDPTLIAISVAAVPVRAPILRAFKVTWASPVRASMAIRLTVFVPPVALPIEASIFRKL